MASVLVGLCMLLACGRSELHAGDAAAPAETPAEPLPDPASGAGGGGVDQPGGFGGATEGAGGGGGVEPEGGAAPLPVAAYANTYDSLYAITADGENTLLGKLEGCGEEITDIALTSENELVVSTADAVYVTHPASLLCEELAAAPYTFPNSLAVLPPGILLTGEAVVGYRDSRYLRIDPTTGDVVILGELSDTGLVSSGDLLWFQGRLVLSATGPGCDDCLVEVDPLTGVDVATLAALDVPSVFGLATWDGGLYAFTGLGQIRRIEGTDGTTVPVADRGETWLGATSPP